MFTNVILKGKKKKDRDVKLLCVLIIYLAIKKV